MSPPLPRRLAVCADDYGASPSISEGIVALASRGRLSAVSCMTTHVHWAHAGAALRELAPQVERGLHFNLTEGAPVSTALGRAWPRLPSLARLMAQTFLGRLPLAAIGEEWRAQWDRFAEATGRPPAFVDGHQHVHQLPGIRNIVLAAIAQAGQPVAVRSTGALAGPAAAWKRAVIRHSGGMALAVELERRGVPHNSVLLGAYDFRAPDYRRLMQAWLANVPAQGGLLFCHPGSIGAAADASDPIGAARRREAGYLGSEDFLADLAQAGVSLGPAWVRRSSAG